MQKSIPVFEQIEPQLQEKIENIQKEYTTALDGSAVRINDYLASPETARDEVN